MRGYPGFSGRAHLSETKLKMSLAAKARGFTEQHRQKITESLRGRCLSEEHKEKISLRLQGNQYRLGIPHSEETRFKLSQKHRKHNSLEQNRAIAEANRNRIYSFETKQKISEARKRYLANPENHPNWQGGIAMHPYPCRFNKLLKEDIRKRDNYQCQLCSVPQMECLSKLHVHHIDYNKANLERQNLISLCNSCNTKVNYKREFWQAILEHKVDKLEKK